MLVKIFYNFFKLDHYGSNIKKESYAGLLTFLSMSYIIIVNPLILSETGMDKDALFTTTIIITAFTTLLMGLYANTPYVLAPGMGLNSFFTYVIVKKMGLSWETALGAVFISGILMVCLTLSPLRKKIVNNLPVSLKYSITMGLGLFLMIIALNNSGAISYFNFNLQILDLTKPSVILSFLGFFIIIILRYLKIKAELIITIIIISIISFILGITSFSGVVAMPPSIEPLVFKLDIKQAIELGFIIIVFNLFLVDFFDSTSMFISLNQNEKPDSSRNKKSLLVDGFGTIVGSMIGSSTIVTFLESTVGVKAGGKTGLTAVVISILVLTCLFFSPILSIIPAFVTAPILFFISCLMLYSFKDIKIQNKEEYIPIATVSIVTPLTFSIFEGLGFGIISFILVKIITKKWEKSYNILILIVLMFILSKLI